MFLFLDESGTPALQGPQPYFAMSAIAFESEARRDVMEETIEQLRRDWGMNAAYEMKFVKLSHERRIGFFVKIGDLPFKVSSCVLRKEGLAGQWTDKCYLYERVIREIVNGLQPYFREVDAAQEKPLRVHAIFDEYTDPEYVRILKQELGRLYSKDGFKMMPKENVKKGRSRTSSLLQVVDMVCRAYRWDTNDYRKYLTAQRLRHVELP
jgi:hypothetical protein